MHGEGGWTSAYGRCEKDARVDGHLPTADVKKMRGGTSAYGRCEKDARGDGHLPTADVKKMRGGMDICLRQM